MTKPIEAGPIDVIRVNSAGGSDVRGELKRFAARSGAEVEHLVSGAGLEQLTESLAALVLYFEERFARGFEAVANSFSQVSFYFPVLFCIR